MNISKPAITKVYTRQWPQRQFKQQGFALMVALVLVIAITGIAVSLLKTSSMDMKMATASEDHEMASQIARGGNDQLYSNAVKRTVDDQNYFASFASGQGATEFTSDQDAISSVSWASAVQVETDCPRSKAPTEGLQCIYLQVNTHKNFGVTNNNRITLMSGVAQQVGIR